MLVFAMIVAFILFFVVGVFILIENFRMGGSFKDQVIGTLLGAFFVYLGMVFAVELIK